MGQVAKPYERKKKRARDSKLKTLNLEYNFNGCQRQPLIMDKLTITDVPISETKKLVFKQPLLIEVKPFQGWKGVLTAIYTPLDLAVSSPESNLEEDVKAELASIWRHYITDCADIQLKKQYQHIVDHYKSLVDEVDL